MYIQLENMCGAILLNNVLLNNYNEFYYCMSFSLYFHYPNEMKILNYNEFYYCMSFFYTSTIQNEIEILILWFYNGNHHRS